MLFSVGPMLAGILVALLLVGGLAFAIPWIAAQRQSPDELIDDPDDRFSESMRIFQRDVIDFGDPLAISTPLTRAAEFTRLSLSARQAASRRMMVVIALLATALLGGILAGFRLVAWWTFLIPLGLVAAFIGVARFTVVRMHARMDAYAHRLEAGFRADEDTVAILDEGNDAQSTEYSVDLSAPQDHGVFWDSVPVTAPTYVQKPILPRTIRTIDLSAPVVIGTPVVPTADRLGEQVDEESMPLPRVIGQ